MAFAGVKFVDDNGDIVSVSPGRPYPLPGGGGGSGGGAVEVSNFPASQAVTGPLTNAQFTAITGAAG